MTCVSHLPPAKYGRATKNHTPTLSHTLIFGHIKRSNAAFICNAPRIGGDPMFVSSHWHASWKDLLIARLCIVQWLVHSHIFIQQQKVVGWNMLLRRHFLSS